MELNSLPEELIHKILCHVSANSFSDLFNAKQACKLFLRIAETGSVYKAVELSKFRGYMAFHDGAKARFLDKCLTNNNPEAVYNIGVRFYFEEDLTNEGLRLLKSAADGGYDRAVYVYAMLQRTLGEAEEAEKYISRLTRDAVREVRVRISQEPGMVWDVLLPEAFKEKQYQFDPTTSVSGCYCKSLFLQLTTLSRNRGVLIGDNSLCDRCFVHLEHLWFLQYFVTHLNYWSVYPSVLKPDRDGKPNYLPD